MYVLRSIRAISTGKCMDVVVFFSFFFLLGVILERRPCIGCKALSVRVCFLSIDLKY